METYPELTKKLTAEALEPLRVNISHIAEQVAEEQKLESYYLPRLQSGRLLEVAMRAYTSWQIADALHAGVSADEIAKALGVTRQRVYQFPFRKQFSEARVEAQKTGKTQVVEVGGWLLEVNPLK